MEIYYFLLYEESENNLKILIFYVKWYNILYVIYVKFCVYIVFKVIFIYCNVNI